MLFKDSFVVLQLSIADKKRLRCVCFPTKSIADMISFTLTQTPLKQERVDLKIPSLAKASFSDFRAWVSISGALKKKKTDSRVLKNYLGVEHKESVFFTKPLAYNCSSLSDLQRRVVPG